MAGPRRILMQTEIGNQQMKDNDQISCLRNSTKKIIGWTLSRAIPGTKTGPRVFTSQDNARIGRDLAKAAYQNGRDDMCQELRDMLGITDQE